MRNTLLLVLLFVTVLLNAQTYFYKLSAVVEGGNRSAGNGSGIYVTFTDKGCYDSDIEGCTMNNGFLNLQFKGKSKIQYKGASYWGAAEYIFSADYKLLNVIAGDCVYIYNKSNSSIQRVSTYSGVKAAKSSSCMSPVHAGVGTGVGTGIGTSIGTGIGVVEDNDEYRGVLSPEQYRKQYARWEKQARSCYESLVDVVNAGNGNELHVNKYKADESVSHQSGMRTLLIRIQGEMRKVRSEAASYGVTIMQSYWETCSPPSR